MRGERVIALGFTGTNQQRIDDTISDSPQTGSEIATKEKVMENLARNHCRFWIAEDLFYDESPEGSFPFVARGTAHPTQSTRQVTVQPRFSRLTAAKCTTNVNDRLQ